jgi:uncharacterized protein with FMN-binding domain
LQAPGPRPLKGKRRRLADGLIGLSSLAIATVYAVGYVNTSSAEPHVSTAPAAQVATSTLPRAPATQRQPAAPTTVPSSPAPAVNVSYQDGTYSGVGTSRHGNIEATVVVKDGKIVSANVSRCMTRYSCSYVDPLVKETVARQVVPVNRVSGATDSSNAYKQAVSNALAKAAALS